MTKIKEKQHGALPQKKNFRQRAHANIFSDHQLEYPVKPADYDWTTHYPDAKGRQVEFADIGCGYGGLLISLSPHFPETLMLGMEIRPKVEEYVRQRIQGLREINPTQFNNVSVIRMNAQKFMPHFFRKLSKLFFLFPDPCFKKKKFKARIITPQLLAEYAFVLKEGGLLYTATDVRPLHEWMVEHLDAHPLFRRLAESEFADDVCIKCAMQKTEEGIKVARNNGDKFLAVYERIADDESREWSGFRPLKDSGLQANEDVEEEEEEEDEQDE